MSWRKKLEKIYEGDISAICNFLEKTEITGIIPESEAGQIFSHPGAICYAFHPDTIYRTYGAGRAGRHTD